MDSAGTMMSMMGTGIGVGANIGMGNAAKKEAEFEANQWRQKAGYDMSFASQAAAAQAARGRAVEGSARAIAAGSGASGGPSISAILGGITSRSNYNVEAELSKGKIAAASDINAANAAEFRGKNAATAARLNAIATGLKGAGSLASKSNLFSSTAPGTASAGTGTSVLDINDNETGWKTRTRRTSDTDIPSLIMGTRFG